MAIDKQHDGYQMGKFLAGLAGPRRLRILHEWQEELGHRLDELKAMVESGEWHEAWLAYNSIIEDFGPVGKALNFLDEYADELEEED